MDSTSDSDIVGLEIIMERNINKYIIHYYIPSFLMLTLSWASLIYRSYIYSGIHSLQKMSVLRLLRLAKNKIFSDSRAFIMQCAIHCRYNSYVLHISLFTLDITPMVYIYNLTSCMVPIYLHVEHAIAEKSKYINLLKFSSKN